MENERASPVDIFKQNRCVDNQNPNIKSVAHNGRVEQYPGDLAGSQIQCMTFMAPMAMVLVMNKSETLIDAI